MENLKENKKKNKCIVFSSNKMNLAKLSSNLLFPLIILLIVIIQIKSKNNTIIIEVNKKGKQNILYSGFNKNLFVYINDQEKYISKIQINVGAITDNIKLVWNTSLTSCANMFNGLTNIKAINFIDFDFSLVTSMSNMFCNCKNLVNVSFNCLNTSNVKTMYTTMQEMFSGCQKLSSLNLTDINTSNVKIMLKMFFNCKNLLSLNLIGFDNSQVTTMQEMFSGCQNLISLNLIDFNTPNVKTMLKMFFNCQNLISLNLIDFDNS